MEQSKKNNDALGQVKSALDKARLETEQTASRVVAEGERLWEDVRTKGEDVLKNAQTKGKEIFENVAEEGLEGLAVVQKYVKRNPGKAVGLALLAGVVVGALFFSSSSKKDE